MLNIVYCTGMSVEHLDNSFLVNLKLNEKPRLLTAATSSQQGIKCAGENIIKWSHN